MKQLSSLRLNCKNSNLMTCKEHGLGRVFGAFQPHAPHEVKLVRQRLKPEFPLVTRCGLWSCWDSSRDALGFKLCGKIFTLLKRSRTQRVGGRISYTNDIRSISCQASWKVLLFDISAWVVALARHTRSLFSPCQRSL